MNNYKKIIKQIGKTYYDVAVSWGRDGTPIEYRAESLRRMSAAKRGKKCRGKMRDVIADIILDVAKVVRKSRRGRRSRKRVCLNNGTADWFVNRNLTVKNFWETPLKLRVELRRHRLIYEAVSSQCGMYSGDTTIDVKYGQPGATTIISRGDQYSKKCTYRKTDAEHIVTVAPDWFHRVYKRGLTVVDGMATLDAEPIAVDGLTVYRASWVRSTGKQISCERGYIAVSEHGTAHAKTIAGAKSLITRRANEKKFALHERKILAALENMELNGYGEILVTLADSYRAGNCKPGTLEFRDRFFPGRESVTVRELLELGIQRKLAINASLQAIRRVRKNHDLAA